jgi:hypothetical protein
MPLTGTQPPICIYSAIPECYPPKKLQWELKSAKPSRRLKISIALPRNTGLISLRKISVPAASLLSANRRAITEVRLNTLILGRQRYRLTAASAKLNSNNGLEQRQHALERVQRSLCS